VKQNPSPLPPKQTARERELELGMTFKVFIAAGLKGHLCRNLF